MRRRIAVFAGSNRNSHRGRKTLEGIRNYCEHASPWIIRTLGHWPEGLGEEPSPGRRAARWPADGAIVYRDGIGQVDRMLKRRGRFPVVSVLPGYQVTDPAQRPKGLSMRVLVDNHQIGRRAAEHLLTCGQQRFAYIGAEGVHQCNQRLEGFCKHLEENDLQCLSFRVDLTRARMIYAHAWLEPDPQVATWLKELPKPVGVFADGDALGREILDSCMALEIRVPQEVAVVGVNDDEDLCLASHPLLSSVPIPFDRIGYEAAGWLDRLMDGDSPPEDLIYIPIPPAIRRESTNIAALDEHLLADAIHFVREHACDPIDVNRILEEVPIGRRRLERGFQRTLGHTPHAEIRRVQMERACKLLIESDLSVGRIAKAVGLTRAHFGKVFSDEQGLSPLAYRREYRGNAAVSSRDDK